MKYNDNELIYYIKEGNSDDAKILYEKYYPYIKSYSSKMATIYKKTGLEECDLHQEGMIGLMNAIDTFDEYKDNKFFTYAKSCIEKKIISAVVMASRNKHKTLNDSVLIDDSNISLFTTQSSYEKLIESEDESKLFNKIKNVLTDFEDQVFQLRLSGVNNLEICSLLDIELKTIDNTLYRIRKKIRKLLNK